MEETLEDFIKAFLIGFILCAPLGPIGILCARRALIYGKLYGIVSLLGASIAEAFYCAIAAFGLSSLIELLANHKLEVRFLGSFVLIFVGAGIYFMDIKERQKDIEKGLMKAFFSTIILTMVSPIPILVFAAAFAATGILSFDGGKLHAFVIVLGVFSGSALWSLIFGIFFTIFKAQFELKKLLIINKIAGFAIGGIGLIGIFTTLPRFIMYFSKMLR